MIDYRVLERLMPVTAEERQILEKGDGSINKKLYMSDNDTIESRLMLQKGKTITVRTHTRFIDFPEHSHDFIEIAYMCSGSTGHVVNGKEVLLSEGELMFLSRRARHSIKCAGESDVMVNFIILPEFFEHFTSVLGDEDTPLKSFVTDSLYGAGGPDYLLFKVSEVLPVQNLVENLIWLLMLDEKSKRNVVRTTMELLFVHLLEHTESLRTADAKYEAIFSLLRYIESNYKDGSLEEAARKLHYDFCWLSKEVKKRTGQTYTELVQKKRLSQAVFYLKNTRTSIADIAHLVGYDNVSYFYRIFSAHYGVTPKKYRDDMQNYSI